MRPDNPVGGALRALDRAIELAVWCGALLAGAALIATTLLYTVEVAARPLGWSTLMADEYSGYMVLAVLSFGLAYVIRHKALLRVDFVYQRFGPRTRRIVAVVYTLLALGFFALLAWRLGFFAYQTFGRGIFAPTPIGTPLYLPQSLIPLGLALACLELLRQLLNGSTFRETDDGEAKRILTE